MNLVMFLLTALSGILEFWNDRLFGFFVLVISLVFLFGCFEKQRERYRAHLFVGSVLVLFFAGFSLISYLVSFLMPLLGEEPKSLTLGDAVLVSSGFISILNVYRGRRK